MEDTLKTFRCIVASLFTRTSVVSLFLVTKIHPGIRCNAFLSLCELSAAFVSSLKQYGRKTKKTHSFCSLVFPFLCRNVCTSFALIVIVLP